MRKSGFEIVKEMKVNIPASLQKMKEGETVAVRSEDFACLQSVRCAAYRLNQSAGFTAYVVASGDNGATIAISRIARAAR